MEEKIYLDYAATTPIDEKVLEVMSEVYRKYPGNPSSIHSFGRESAIALDRARDTVAKFLGSAFNEILFTGSATESNNMAIRGLLSQFKRKYPDKKFHLITSEIEHSSVREVFNYLEESGEAEVTRVGVDKEGLVDQNEIKDAIKQNTVLVSVMYANNEIGTIQPIRKIGKIVRKANEAREREFKNRKSSGERGLSFDAYSKIYFHTDAVQAANYLSCNVDNLLVDLLTLSGHKIYGPKGVSVLYMRQGTPMYRLMHGGEQELSLRSGTYNLPGIIGMAEAVSQLTEEFREAESARLLALRDRALTMITETVPDAALNGSIDSRLPNNLNLSFGKRSGEMMMLTLDQKGIAVSTGSACASGSVEPSHVLTSMGIDPDRVGSSLRVSFGRQTTENDLKILVEKLKELTTLKR